MRLLATTAALALLTAMPASADCTRSGTDVTCTGTDADGFRERRDAVDVTVGVGASVTNATGDALRLQAGGSIAIGAGGRVATTGPDGDDAIQVEGVTVITNDGTIDGFDEGINADGVLTLTNGVAGVIRANDDAVKGEDVRIVNFGLIENVGTDATDPQDAIDLDYGSVVNEASGVIRSTLDAAIDFDETEVETASTIVNRGLIEGISAVLTDRPTSAPSRSATRACCGAHRASRSISARATTASRRPGRRSATSGSATARTRSRSTSRGWAT